MLYPQDFTFTSPSGLIFQKLNDSEFSWWVCLNSLRTVFLRDKLESINDAQIVPDSEFPLYDKHGKLNRYGFKWTDQQIKEYYNL